MDKDLERFVSALQENTRAQKRLHEVVTKQNTKMETIIEMTKTMLRGDPNIKVKPLVIMLAELNHLLSLIGPDLRYIAQRISGATKIPKVLETLGEFFKPGKR